MHSVHKIPVFPCTKKGKKKKKNTQMLHPIMQGYHCSWKWKCKCKITICPCTFHKYISFEFSAYDVHKSCSIIDMDWWTIHLVQILLFDGLQPKKSPKVKYAYPLFRYQVYQVLVLKQISLGFCFTYKPSKLTPEISDLPLFWSPLNWNDQDKKNDSSSPWFLQLHYASHGYVKSNSFWQPIIVS